MRIWWVSARSLAEQAERMEIPRPPATDLRMAQIVHSGDNMPCREASGIFCISDSGHFLGSRTGFPHNGSQKKIREIKGITGCFLLILQAMLILRGGTSLSLQKGIKQAVWFVKGISTRARSTLPSRTSHTQRRDCRIARSENIRLESGR